jgi:transposase-like protein
MREMSVTEERYKAVQGVLADGRTVSEVAGERGVCRRCTAGWCGTWTKACATMASRNTQI